jgi:hypothetical protein
MQGEPVVEPKGFEPSNPTLARMADVRKGFGIILRSVAAFIEIVSFAQFDQAAC